MRNSISACDSAMVAGFNRRMPKTARPVVWEDLRAQSRRPDPIGAGRAPRISQMIEAVHEHG